MNPDQVKIRYLKGKLSQGLSLTRDEKQWVIDQCIRRGSRVSLRGRLVAQRAGFKTAGLLVA